MQAGVALEQERHAAALAQQQSAALQAQLRSTKAGTGAGQLQGGGSGRDAAGGGGSLLKRPLMSALSVAGWEDLVEEAAADLEQVEAQVGRRSIAAGRLAESFWATGSARSARSARFLGVR